MKRHLLILALAGLCGGLWAADATACCHKKQACGTPACEPPPPPPPPPTCETPKCGLFHHNSGCGHKKMFGCHKKPACEPVVCETPAPAPVYAAPAAYYPSPQASPQASHQGY